MTDLQTHVFQFVEATVNAQRATTPEQQEYAIAIAADAFRACFMDLVKEGIERAKELQTVPVSERADSSR